MTYRMQLALTLDDFEGFIREKVTRFAEGEDVTSGTYTRYLYFHVDDDLINKFGTKYGLEVDRGLTLLMMDICKIEWEAALKNRGFINVDVREGKEITHLMLRYERPWRSSYMDDYED